MKKQKTYHLHTETYGEPTKPLVVLLHGIMGSSRTWHHLVDEISEDYYVLSVDLLGFGASPKPRVKYGLEDHIEALHRALDRHDALNPHMLVGFSLGGLLAVHLIRLGGVVPERLLLLAPPLYGVAGEMSRRIKFSPTPAIFRKGPIARTTQNVRRHVPGLARAIAKVTHPEAPQVVVDDVSRATYHSYIRTRQNVLEAESLIEVFPSVGHVSIVAGTHDQYADIEHLRRLVEGRGKLQIIDGMGHSLPFAAPSYVVAAIKQLSRVDAVEGARIS